MVNLQFVTLLSASEFLLNFVAASKLSSALSSTSKLLLCSKNSSNSFNKDMLIMNYK